MRRPTLPLMNSRASWSPSTSSNQVSDIIRPPPLESRFPTSPPPCAPPRCSIPCVSSPADCPGSEGHSSPNLRATWSPMARAVPPPPPEYRHTSSSPRREQPCRRQDDTARGEHPRAQQVCPVALHRGGPGNRLSARHAGEQMPGSATGAAHAHPSTPSHHPQPIAPPSHSAANTALTPGAFPSPPARAPRIPTPAPSPPRQPALHTRHRPRPLRPPHQGGTPFRDGLRSKRVGPQWQATAARPSEGPSATTTRASPVRYSFLKTT